MANRRLNTYGKKEIHLLDEMNSKIVIEEYVEDKSDIPSRPSMQLSNAN